jgi:hypothetical protein
MDSRFDVLMDGDRFLSNLWFVIPTGVLSGLIWVMYAALLKMKIRSLRAHSTFDP